MLWLKKLNFMETAKLEMELMKALDAGEDLEEARGSEAVGGIHRRCGASLDSGGLGQDAAEDSQDGIHAQFSG